MKKSKKADDKRTEKRQEVTEREGWYNFTPTCDPASDDVMKLTGHAPCVCVCIRACVYVCASVCKLLFTCCGIRMTQFSPGTNAMCYSVYMLRVYVCTYTHNTKPFLIARKDYISI